ncbi:MAG: allophanate hydrolase [Steroidobacteraceae bacterium]|jgi:allophanate hydrolase
MSSTDRFLLDDLRAGYRAGRFRPLDVVETAWERAERAQALNLWITRLTPAQVRTYLERLNERPIEELPLFGIPFVIKDNIDLAGIATTAACREFAYVPERSATVVERLIEAGAIPLGKTNLDQFATGLVGTRSPYGICRNSFNPDYISGGSSSGSAIAVALGIASFALGTDTAGSGRVPAAFNNIVGLKPSLGRLSTRGVVPACRSLDCVSIFALTAEDAALVLAVAEAFDSDDAYSRLTDNASLRGSRIGIPRPDQLEFFGDEGFSRLFARAVARARELGFTVQLIDFEPFLETARLLYEGPWTAERYAAVESLIESKPDALHPVTHRIIAAARSLSAVAAFKAQYRLMELKRRSDKAWDEIDILMTPTAGTLFTVAELEGDPINLNSRLGYYTNFVNLLDLAAVAVPAGFRADALPFGISLIGPRATDRALLALGARLHRVAVDTLGAMPWTLPAAPPAPAITAPDIMGLAVCGAHMEGLPLNRELRDRGGRLLRKARTAACYRLFALPGARRPGLVRVSEGGAPIEVEVWGIRAADFGSLVRAIPAPLGIGTVELEDGECVAGFLCEAHALDIAEDITRCGSWRGYLAELAAPRAT